MNRARIALVVAGVDLLVFIPAALADPNRDLGADMLYLVAIGAYLGIGALLVDRVPGNPIGVLMIATGTILAATVAIGVYADIGKLQDPAWPGFERARAIADAMFIYPALIALVGIPLVFPDGRLLSARFRWVVVGTIAGMIAWMLNSVFGTSLDLVVLVSVPLAFGGAVTAVALRFRRGDPVQRQQVKWLAADVSVGAIALLAGLLVNGLNSDLGTVLFIVGIFALFALPFVIGIAILRYRLYEIDRIISRTLSYAVVTAILGAVFVGVILLLQSGLTGVTGNQGIPVAVSTLAVFALFQPVLRRVQRAVDRRFDRARYDGERTAGEFADRLRWETDMERVTADLRTTVVGAVAPADITVWLRTGRPSR